jgi:hypothetical protein
MRSDRVRRALAALAVACLALLAVACSSGPAGGHPGGAKARSAAAGVPKPLQVRGVLTASVAATAYRAAIVPAYPVAVHLADELAYRPSAAAAQIPGFAASLSKALGSIAAVTAFPRAANGAFTGYLAQARALLATLASPAAVTSSMASRQQAALELYALARQIGVLGNDLNLVPATQAGGKH